MYEDAPLDEFADEDEYFFDESEMSNDSEDSDD
jgi:hypothetical protein